jgi:protein-disulfide isomerase
MHNEHKKDMSMVLMVLSVVTVLLTVYVAFVKMSAVGLETMKSGGAENFANIQKIWNSEQYKTAQAQGIQQALASLNTPTQDTANDATPSATTIDKAKIDGIKKSGYVKGKANARITILEYSEFLCPYCKRQSDSKTIEQVVAKYPNDVNTLFRNYIVHGDPAKVPAEAVECAGELG